MKNLRWIRSIALITMAVLSVVGEVRGESTHTTRADAAVNGSVTSAAATPSATPAIRRL